MSPFNSGKGIEILLLAVSTSALYSSSIISSCLSSSTVWLQQRLQSATKKMRDVIQQLITRNIAAYMLGPRV